MRGRWNFLRERLAGVPGALPTECVAARGWPPPVTRGRSDEGQQRSRRRPLAGLLASFPALADSAFALQWEDAMADVLPTPVVVWSSRVLSEAW